MSHSQRRENSHKVKESVQILAFTLHDICILTYHVYIPISKHVLLHTCGELFFFSFFFGPFGNLISDNVLTSPSHIHPTVGTEL